MTAQVLRHHCEVFLTPIRLQRTSAIADRSTVQENITASSTFMYSQ